MRRSRLSVTSSVVDAIASGARSESEVWAAALREAPEWEPVFSPLAPDELALGLETVYEAYLVHYGARASSTRRTPTRRCYSATTSMRTGSCGLPRRAASTRCGCWPI